MKEGCRRQRREARDKQDGEGGKEEDGVRTAVSRAEEDSSGHAAWGECME